MTAELKHPKVFEKEKKMKWMLMICVSLIAPAIANAEQPRWRPQGSQSQVTNAEEPHRRSQQSQPQVTEHHHIYHGGQMTHRRVGPQLSIGGLNILGINLWESHSAPVQNSFFGGYSPNVRIMDVPVARLDGGFWSSGYLPPLRTYGQYYGGGYRGGYGRGGYGGGYQPRNWSHLRNMTQPHRR